MNTLAKKLRPGAFPLFDYAGLNDADLERGLRASTTRIRELRRAAIVDIGRELLAAKERLPHGQFMLWVEAEFGWNRSTASRMMNVASVFGEPMALDLSTVRRSRRHKPGVAADARSIAFGDPARRRAEGCLMTEVVLTRAQETARRRVERWMRPDGWKDAANFDAPAYRRMADELLGAMTAVGPAHAQEGVAALVKTVALIGHQLLLGTDEANVRDFGDAVGKMVATEILGLRLKLLPHVRKGN